MSLNKVLFLDIDNVLNTRPDCLDEDKVKPVLEIIKKTGCKIVISSTWRFEKEKLLRLSEALKVDLYLTAEPEFRGILWESKSRGEEIKEWLENQYKDYEKIVILDDMEDLRPMQEFHVKINGEIGLTSAIKDDILRKLNL